MSDLTINLSVVFAGNTAERLAQLKDLMAKLRELEIGWQDIGVGECHANAALDSLGLNETPLVPLAVGKLVDLYAAILEERKQPMHVREIAAEALRRGAVLRGGGQASPKQKVRNSLFGSKKFVNVGGNTWWLANKPIPEESQE